MKTKEITVIRPKAITTRCRIWFNQTRNKWAISCVAVLAIVGTGLGLGIASGANDPSNGYSPTVISQLPPAKQAVIDRVLQAAGVNPATGQASGSASGSTKKTPPTNLQPIPSVTSLPSGIGYTPQPPFGASFFSATDMWSGEAASQWWWVFAGSVGDEQPYAGAGGLVLLSVPDTANTAAPQTQQGPFILENTSAGALTITSESGSDLAVSSTSGLSCVFNLDTLTFSGQQGC